MYTVYVYNTHNKEWRGRLADGRIFFSDDIHISSCKIYLYINIYKIVDYVL
jgi:hypothetical protein